MGAKTEGVALDAAGNLTWEASSDCLYDIKFYEITTDVCIRTITGHNYSENGALNVAEILGGENSDKVVGIEIIETHSSKFDGKPSDMIYGLRVSQPTLTSVNDNGTYKITWTRPDGTTATEEFVLE